MADWKKLCMSLVLADGVIDDAEVRVLRKELWADGEIDKGEVNFLIELRNAAQKKAKGGDINASFERMFFKALEDNALKDGKIDSREANWLRSMLYADGKIDDNEKKFLRRLKKNAEKTSPTFDKLYAEAVEGEAPADKPAAKKSAPKKRSTTRKK